MFRMVVGLSRTLAGLTSGPGDMCLMHHGEPGTSSLPPALPPASAFWQKLPTIHPAIDRTHERRRPFRLDHGPRHGAVIP